MRNCKSVGGISSLCPWVLELQLVQGGEGKEVTPFRGSKARNILVLYIFEVDLGAIMMKSCYISGKVDFAAESKTPN